MEFCEKSRVNEINEVDEVQRWNSQEYDKIRRFARVRNEVVPNLHSDFAA